MSGNLADFSGSIPQNYDRGMGPTIFAGYAIDIARWTACHAPSRGLVLAAVKIRVNLAMSPSRKANERAALPLSAVSECCFTVVYY